MDQTVRHLERHMRAPGEAEQQGRSAAQGADIHRIREFNRRLVLNYVREHGPVSRVMIAQRLGLSRTTVSSIMDTLLQEGFVREGHFLDAAPRGGRRAILVHFNADAGRILGIDVGRTHLTMLLTNLTPAIVAQRSVPFDTDRGPEVCLSILISEIRTFVEASATSWDVIAGIGVGIPGPLSDDLHRLISPPHMPGWDNVDVWEQLYAAFHKPLYIDNDANMGALGEVRCGAGRGDTNMAYVKIGTGIGGGLILNGRIYRGHQGSAGELGHLTIDENGPRCVCGGRGCLETLAGSRAIIADAEQGLSLARKQAQEGQGDREHTPDAQPARTFDDIMDVVEAAHRGDAACIAALERAGERIALALAGLINLVNPASIILDGGVARAGD
ncbi:MAG TPA: ROK family transcriptional regulator, partial [Ktedonobacteraceae bacterium]|nr:ROK family transcriptional regulator [Ktedonobacteraceae bacterium]